MSENPGKARANERQPLVVAARLRRARQTALCEVVNLSETGCKLKVVANFVAVGDSVSIKPEGLEALHGTVRWKEGVWLGLQFDNPMYRPVVDHLAKMHVSKL